MFKSRIAAAALIAATLAGCDKTMPPISEARPVRTVAVEQGAELVRAASSSASCFRYNFGLLLAKVQATVGAEDARPDLIARPEVLRPAALRLEEQRPKLAVGEQLDDAANRRRRDTQRAAGGRSGEEDVARRDVRESRQL
jgi:hypothetical protein